MKRSGKKPRHLPVPKLAYKDPEFMESLRRGRCASSPNISIR